MYCATVEERPLDKPLPSVGTTDATAAELTPTSPPAARPESRRPVVHPLRLGTKSPTSGPYPWPSWAPAVATAVPHRLRHIVEVMRHIELDWLMSASMPCDLVSDVDDPAVELALMLLEG